VHIVVFKHSDCKFKHIYSFNMCPELANTENPEMNEKQTYSKLPYEVKLSMDCVFLAVTLCNGEVKLLKMPPIFNPLGVVPPVQVEPVLLDPKSLAA